MGRAQPSRLGHSQDRQTLAWQHHRRWWKSNIQPPGPPAVRVLEDDLTVRITEPVLPDIRVVEA